MDMQAKIRMLRVAGEFDDEDEVLSAYLYRARQLILNILYPTEPNRGDMEVPSMYEAKELEIAEYLLAKRGAEGQTRHSENGITRHFGSGHVPEAMLRDITPFCGVVK